MVTAEEERMTKVQADVTGKQLPQEQFRRWLSDSNQEGVARG